VEFASLGFFMRTALLLLLVASAPVFACCAAPICVADEPIPEGISSREAKASATRIIPFQRLNPNATELVRDVVQNPSYFRRMPPQEIDCNPEMFTFLVRRPEVMVNIWELMGITQVSTKRTSPYSFLANDGVGTTAKCDLIYGDENLHIYYGTGNYDGNMTPRKMTGRCVCILQSRTSQDQLGEPMVAGTMDVFLKLDNFGADLLTRTLGPLVGKTADANFVETAKFMSQISQICVHNPAAAQGLAEQLENVDRPVRQEFATIAAKIAEQNRETNANHLLRLSNAAAIQSEAERSQADSAKVLPTAIEQEPLPDLQLSSSGPVRDSLSDSFNDSLNSAPRSSRNLTSNANSSRLPIEAMSLPVAAGAVLTAPANAVPVDRPPTAIRPRKPNIFMRR
jgi:hypothetical protein